MNKKYHKLPWAKTGIRQRKAGRIMAVHRAMAACQYGVLSAQAGLVIVSNEVPALKALELVRLTINAAKTVSDTIQNGNALAESC